MGIVAVDAYMHWAVHGRLSAVRRKGELPKALRQLQVSFSELASLADATVSARRQRSPSRPWVHAKNAAQKQLLRMTFESSQEVGNAMAMVGVKDGWKHVAAIMRTGTEKAKGELDKIVARRNQIVHEGDLARRSRPRGVKLNPISRAEVERNLSFLQRLLEALHEVMKNAE